MKIIQQMIAKLEELDLKMVAYTEKSKSDCLVELADEVQDTFRTLNEDLQKVN